MRGVTLLCLLFAACDDSESSPRVVSCTISIDMADGRTIKACTEVSGSVASDLQQACRSETVSFPDGGPALTQRTEFAAEPCSRVNALGGCLSTEHGAP